MIPKSQKILTQVRLKELLYYDPDTGIFTRRVCRGGRAISGSVANAERKDGYHLVCVDSHTYYAHRLAVFYMTGTWPEELVDHINGVRGDNRWHNLRVASRSENAQNIIKPKHNTSGLIGAQWNKQAGKWRSEIWINNKAKFLGYHPTAEAAHAAYLKAKDELHPTHLRLREVA